MSFEFSEYSIESLGRSGYSSVRIKVRGYWSSDLITVYIERQPSWHVKEGQEPKWIAKISHSSGGRDTKEVESDIVAERYFAHALLGASDLAERILEQTTELEKFWLDEQMIRKEQIRLEKEQQQQRIDADPELGLAAATAMVEMAALGDMKYIQLYNRGEERTRGVAEAAVRYKTKFYINGHVISRKDLIATLTAMSVRTHLKKTYHD